MKIGVHVFDKVMVATGPFREPITPNIPGMTEFHGSILHVKDFRLKSSLAGKRVVILGNLCLNNTRFPNNAIGSEYFAPSSRHVPRLLPPFTAYKLPHCQYVGSRINT